MLATTYFWFFSFPWINQIMPRDRLKDPLCRLFLFLFHFGFGFVWLRHPGGRHYTYIHKHLKLQTAFFSQLDSHHLSSSSRPFHG